MANGQNDQPVQAAVLVGVIRLPNGQVQIQRDPGLPLTAAMGMAANLLAELTAQRAVELAGSRIIAANDAGKLVHG